MKAISQTTYGPPAGLRLCDVDPPHAGPGEVVVSVAAAGVDRGAWHQVTGLPYTTRVVFGLRRPANPVPGMDLAGTVHSVGRGVTRFLPGDRVFGIGTGTWAERAVAAEADLAPAPVQSTEEEAAVLAVTGLTALQAVRDHGRVKAGHEVLIIGASGGVGTYAVQLARARDAHVTGVASTAKLDLVRTLGAHRTIDYTTADPVDGSTRYDVIIDLGGNTPLSRLRRALRPTGALVIVGGEGGGRWLGGMHRQVLATVRSTFSRQRLGTFVSAPNPADLAELAGRVDAGTLTPVLDRTYPLVDAAAALDHLVTGRPSGKVALTVSS